LKQGPVCLSVNFVTSGSKSSEGILFIFLTFLKLGCIAFGGPVAHLGYFQESLIRRRRWLSEAEYADLVAFCQFLPGPASSQVGFALGLKRGGVPGAFAAWLGFTLPSAVIMIAFAYGLSVFGNLDEAGWVLGLKLAAVAVVAQAIWNMAAKLCPDSSRALIALFAATFLLLLPVAAAQVWVIFSGGLAGWLLFRNRENKPPPSPPSPAGGRFWLLWVFVGFLLGLPLLRLFFPDGTVAMIEGFYRAGSLVFGGGHVVLPLLNSFTVGQGWIDRDTFLAGYGAAQAIPGPLFTFTAFLGSSLEVGPGGVWGGLVALTAVYVPSWLLVIGALPSWDRLRTVDSVQAALRGTNAAVVGLLLAAFYQPVWTTAVTSAPRLALAVFAFALLRFGKCPPWLIVVGSALGGGLMF